MSQNITHHYYYTEPAEFKFIKKYFKKNFFRQDVLLGIGDDAALLHVPSEQALVVTMDTLVEGTHFPVGTLATDLGHKALAVNLSDLAAMGAVPSWITLSLTLPEANEVWLEHFSEGLFALANRFQVQLIGGDTTRGPLSVTIQAYGFVPPNESLRRNGAKVGDKIYVSGTLGDAGLGLQVALNHLDLSTEEKHFVLERLNRPTPRVELGLLLRDFATSCIDISDGLLADLSHVLEASHVGAELYAEAMPLSNALKNNLSREEAFRLAFTAGDDYELCFTISPIKEKEFQQTLLSRSMHCHCIGEIQSTKGIAIQGFDKPLPHFGFEHF